MTIIRFKRTFETLRNQLSVERKKIFTVRFEHKLKIGKFLNTFSRIFIFSHQNFNLRLIAQLTTIQIRSFPIVEFTGHL